MKLTRFLRALRCAYNANTLVQYAWISLPCLSFATVSPSLGLETGFGFDAISQNGRAASALVEDKYKRIWTYDAGINGRLDIDHAFILAQGTYRTLMTAPHLYVVSNGAVFAKTELAREYGFDLGLSTGYGLTYGALIFSPEVGFSYQQLRTNHNIRFSVGAPFAGFQIDWHCTPRWRLHTYFNYSFLGFRRENVPNDATAATTTRISMGSYSGPAGGLAFGYSFVKQWDLRFGFNAKYIESTNKIWQTPTERTAANTTWLRLNSHVEITYNF